jgi:hypothetical protein
MYVQFKQIDWYEVHILTWIAIQSICILEVSSDNCFQIVALLKKKIKNKGQKKKTKGSKNYEIERMAIKKLQYIVRNVERLYP